MVGMVDYIQQIGHPAGPGVVAEVEASHAERSVLRSNDYDHGAYSVGFGGVIGGSSITAGTNIFLAGLQWISTRNFALIKKITGTLCAPNNGVAAGVIRIYVSRASSYTQQVNLYNPAGAVMPELTSVVLGAGNKHRNTMLNSDASGLRMSSTFAGTAGNAGSPGGSLVYASTLPVAGAASLGGQYTVDALPLGLLIVPSGVSAPSHLRAYGGWQTIFDSEIGPPLILENFTGLIFSMDTLQISTGSPFCYAFNIQWDEVFTYPLGANT